MQIIILYLHERLLWRGRVEHCTIINLQSIIIINNNAFCLYRWLNKIISTRTTTTKELHCHNYTQIQLDLESESEFLISILYQIWEFNTEFYDLRFYNLHLSYTCDLFAMVLANNYINSQNNRGLTINGGIVLKWIYNIVCYVGTSFNYILRSFPFYFLIHLKSNTWHFGGHGGTI